MIGWLVAWLLPTIGKCPRRWASIRFTQNLALSMFALVLSAPAGAQGTGNVDDASNLQANPAPQSPRRVTTGTYLPYALTSLQPAVPKARATALDKGVFLVASPEMRDPNFSKTVVLLVDYDSGGAMGVVINRPTQIVLASVLPQLEGLEDRRVYFGGPVARNRIVLLVRSKTEPTDATHVIEDIYMSASQATLREMLDRTAPGDAFHAYAGYAGWAPGQLEGELTRGDWQVSEADPQAVFHPDPSKVWPELIRQNSGLWVRGPYQERSRVGSDCGPRTPGCAGSAGVWPMHAHMGVKP